jgi:2'-5' RNA ligase
MPDRPDSALLFFPPAAVAQVVNRWRRIYDPNVDTIEPHISLVYPFNLTAAEWPAQRTAFAASLEGFGPFHIQITRINRFLSPGLVLWLEPEDGGVIVRMYRRLEEHFPTLIEPPRPPFSVVPHMTVGFFDRLEDLEVAQQHIAAELTCLEFDVTELVFGASIGQGKWGRVDAIRLGPTFLYSKTAGF